MTDESQEFPTVKEGQVWQCRNQRYTAYVREVNSTEDPPYCTVKVQDRDGTVLETTWYVILMPEKFKGSQEYVSSGYNPGYEWNLVQLLYSPSEV